jgi:hypothetical protein
VNIWLQCTGLFKKKYTLSKICLKKLLTLNPCPVYGWKGNLSKFWSRWSEAAHHLGCGCCYLWRASMSVGRVGLSIWYLPRHMWGSHRVLIRRENSFDSSPFSLYIYIYIARCHMFSFILWRYSPSRAQVSSHIGGFLNFLVPWSSSWQACCLCTIYTQSWFICQKPEPSRSEAGETWLKIMAVQFCLHAVNLRHGINGFTSPPKEGVLRILSPLKSIVLGRVWTLEHWVQWQAR